MAAGGDAGVMCVCVCVSIASACIALLLPMFPTMRRTEHCMSVHVVTAPVQEGERLNEHKDGWFILWTYTYKYLS